MIKYLGLCVSTKLESWPFSPMPFYCYSESKQFPRTKSRDRIDFLANAWNKCHTEGLTLYPEATHIINVGSQYLHQVESLRRLIIRYESIGDECILAGNVWAKLEDSLTPFYTTYDTWATPDLQGLSYRFKAPNFTIQLSSVGMPCIYPVESWRLHPFHNPESMLDGIWYNQFCKDSKLPVLADLSIQFFRTWRDSDIKRHSFPWRVKHEIHHDLISIKKKLLTISK